MFIGYSDSDFLMKFSYMNFVIRCLILITNYFLKFQCIIANFVYMVLIYVECWKFLLYVGCWKI